MVQFSSRMSQLKGSAIRELLALANKPEILFADEPTGNLDGQTGRMVLELLRELNRELGITLVLVTHDLGVAEQAQRVIHLTDGKIARDSGGVQL
mgnify:CR=1 FL=1